MFRKLSLFSLPALALWAAMLPANEHEVRWYDVEVVIFENLNVPESQNTLWAKQAYSPRFEKAISLTPGFADELALAPTLLPEDTHRLETEAHTITESSRYQLLFHKSWRLAGTPLEDAAPVRIQVGTPSLAFVVVESDTSEFNPRFSAGELEADKDRGNFDVAIQTPSDPAENFQPAFAQIPNDSFDIYQQIELYPLDGTITVALGRYLHVYTDLALSRVGDDGQLHSFIVKTHRRMRSQKLHYIDHPKVGMLVLITPFEVEDVVEDVVEAEVGG